MVSLHEEPCGFDMQRLLAVLAWDPAALSTDQTYADYREVIYALLNRAIERALALGITGVAETVKELAALDERTADRLTLAPETSHRLLRGDCDSAMVEFLRRSCEAELAAMGQCSPKSAVWTALGDRYIPGTMDSYEAYSAPRAGSIVVDYLSPHAEGIRGPDRVDGKVPSDVQVGLACRKLAAAFNLLREIESKVAAFVDQQVSTLVLRSNCASDAIGSSSTPDYIGRVVLWNAHLRRADIGELVEQLIHEAIHCHVYKIELRVPFFVAPGCSASLKRIMSPWTGRVLNVHNYLHASFVWYGLANFWLAAVERQTLPERAIAPHLVQSVQGFMLDPVQLLGLAVFSITDPVLLVLNGMHRSIQDRWEKCAACAELEVTPCR